VLNAVADLECFLGILPRPPAAKHPDGFGGGPQYGAVIVDAYFHLSGLLCSVLVSGDDLDVGVVSLECEIGLS
jgi:hypothetical protein